jgi:hypothetical protein
MIARKIKARLGEFAMDVYHYIVVGGGAVLHNYPPLDEGRQDGTDAGSGLLRSLIV